MSVTDWEQLTALIQAQDDAAEKYQRLCSNYWQQGLCGSSNIVMYDGEDVGGIARTEYPLIASEIIQAHNARPLMFKLRNLWRTTRDHRDQIRAYSKTRSAQDQAKSLTTGLNLDNALEALEAKHEHWQGPLPLPRSNSIIWTPDKEKEEE